MSGTDELRNVTREQQQFIKQIVANFQSRADGEVALTQAGVRALTQQCLTLLVTNGYLKPFVRSLREFSTRQAVEEWNTSDESFFDSLWVLLARELDDLVKAQSLDT